MVSLSNWHTYRPTPFCNGARGKPEGKNKCELDIPNLKCKFIYSILPNLTTTAPHTVNTCGEYVCAHHAPSHPRLSWTDTDPTLLKGLHDNYRLCITMRDCIAWLKKLVLILSVQGDFGVRSNGAFGCDTQMTNISIIRTAFNLLVTDIQLNVLRIGIRSFVLCTLLSQNGTKSSTYISK